MSRWITVRSHALDVPCADVLKALSDTTRLKIVELLFDRDRNVADINGVLRMDQTLLSHHLRVLRTAGLVEADRQGRHVIYSLAQRIRTARRGRQLDFGCCTLSFGR